MSNESSQPSTPLNSAIDLSVVRVLRALDPIARSSRCEYFLAGATARDLILVNVHGLRPGRATRDIDFGIAVESWAQFELLRERLLAANDFSASRAQQRLTFADPNEGISIPVDLIPFRGVASANGTIAWPPSRDIVMNVAGFEEALTSSVLIEIEEDLTVHVASVAGLTLLKLAAWVDRGRESNKDAADLYRLLTTYADAGNTDRLYDTELDLLEAAGFDMRLAGAELLGRDIAAICDARILHQVLSILSEEGNRERLVIDMVRSSATYAEATPFVERTLDAFNRGVQRDGVRRNSPE
ncbi:MAG TPA: nucleotidyl transferase AbiEii/AbiGii toxin family protein [Bryobacteraceae bacterium]|jgi:predicted nucleotidyltransferase|nr:nucleotidyl transferase AbiEii/AbiGii toxin family protein [Bryobacteraceae bacterium]